MSWFCQDRVNFYRSREGHRIFGILSGRGSGGSGFLVVSDLFHILYILLTNIFTVSFLIPLLFSVNFSFLNP